MSPITSRLQNAAWRFASRRTPKTKAFAWSAGCAVLFVTTSMVQAADPIGHIRGIVRNEQGSPLAGVKVQLCGMEKFRDGSWHREIRLGEMPWFTTDKEGHFTVPVREAHLRFDFYCDRPDYAPTFLYAVTNNSELDVILKRGLTVTGTVKRMAGGKMESLQGAAVELRLPSQDLWYQQRTITDQNGHYAFHVTQPPAGKKWQVVFSGEVVELDVKEDQPVNGPDFEVSVSVNEKLTSGIGKEDALRIARQAVAKNDNWVERAEFETPTQRDDGSWSVHVWRLPKTPGGDRLILIDEQGRVMSYVRGH